MIGIPPTLLLPAAADLAGWAGVGFATLALLGLGRLISGGRALPEAALIAGWGAMALVLTLWGVALPLSLRWPAMLLAALGLIGLALPRSRLVGAEWRGICRILVLALPLLAVMASARPSLPDTFLNLLPNAAYLYDHAAFPFDGGPDAHSYLPGAPYNLQIAGFVVALPLTEFPPAALIGFNVVLILAVALVLARLISASEDDPQAVPSWGAAALGLLLVTLLNPGFVTRYDLSSYSETSVTVTLAFAGYFASRRGDRMALLLALALAALVNIKQDSVALVAAVVATAALLPADSSRGRALGRLALAALPAAILYLAWRWYVLTHFGEAGELKNQPLAQWQFGALPSIMWSIVRAMAEKFPFFGALFVVVAAVLIGLKRGVTARGMRLGFILVGVALIYNAALLFSYIAHFAGQMSTDAHSYFRYNTHLSLLLMATIVLLAREKVGSWVERRSLRRRWLACAAVVAVLVSPVVFIQFLRFDLEEPQLRAWELARETAARIGPADRLALILPGDNASLAPMLEGVLRLTPPRRNDVVLEYRNSFTPTTLDGLAADTRWALLSCAPPGLAEIRAGQAALYAHDVTGWHVAAIWPYAPARQTRWSRVVAPIPLCLGG
jgi:hypothetical protein